MKETILIVDDESSIRSSLKNILEYEKYNIFLAENGRDALKIIQDEKVDIVLLDVKMPGMDGLQVLTEIKKIDTDITVIMISGHSDIATAVQSTKLGAFDFLEKPLDRDRILLTVKNGLEQKRLLTENKIFKDEIEKQYSIIGESKAIKDVISIIERVGPTQTRVLITGENGTGKELVARAIHKKSPRANQPFIQVNCAAIPKDLIESELFGHEKGSFTGATQRRIGKFEQADTGTIFLDEIGDMSFDAQAKILRILQEGELERVGGSKPIKVDVRVISATNKNILKEIEKGNFREDLYFRLNVVPIHVPPLRERKEDIPILANHFINRYCEENNLKKKSFTKSALELLTTYPWQGNVRELKNLVERLAIMTQKDVIDKEDIPRLDVISGKEDDFSLFYTARTFQEFKDKMEYEFLKRRLSMNNWNVSKTAKELDMQRSNIYKKMEKYGLADKLKDDEEE